MRATIATAYCALVLSATSAQAQPTQAVWFDCGPHSIEAYWDHHGHWSRYKNGRLDNRYFKITRDDIYYRGHKCKQASPPDKAD